MAITCKRWIGLLCFENQINRFPCNVERRVLQSPFAEHGRVPRSNQKIVALAQRDFELFSEVQDHFATRGRAARFEKTEVARGDSSFEGQAELAHATTVTPLAEKIADRPIWHTHRRTVTHRKDRVQLPPR